MAGEFDHLALGQADGVAERIVDVVGLQVGVGLEDLLSRLAGGQEAKQSGHGESQIPDAGLP
jgi:hypothetical protein